MTQRDDVTLTFWRHTDASFTR